MHLLPLGLDALETLVDHKTTRWAMSGVQLTVHGDDTFVAQATNGKAALRITGACVANQANNPYPAIPALDSAPNGECSSIIPGKEWKAAFAAAKKVKTFRHVMKSVAVVIGKEVSTLASTNESVLNFNQPKNVEGRFPAIDQVLRKPSEAFATCRLTPSVVVDTFSALGKLNGDSPVCVDFYNTKKGGAINFIGLRNMEATWKIEGALMPCSAEKEDDKPMEDESSELADLRQRVKQLEACEDMEHMIKISTDSIAELRPCDVQRVIDSCPHSHRVFALANYIVTKRPDLLEKVQEAFKS